MIDNTAIFMFGALIVYTAFRAINLDRELPWFTSKSKQEESKPKKGSRQ